MRDRSLQAISCAFSQPLRIKSIVGLNVLGRERKCPFCKKKKTFSRSQGLFYKKRRFHAVGVSPGEKAPPGLPILLRRLVIRMVVRCFPPAADTLFCPFQIRGTRTKKAPGVRGAERGPISPAGSWKNWRRPSTRVIIRMSSCGRRWRCASTWSNPECRYTQTTGEEKTRILSFAPPPSFPPSRSSRGRSRPPLSLSKVSPFLTRACVLNLARNAPKGQGFRGFLLCACVCVCFFFGCVWVDLTQIRFAVVWRRGN